MPRQGQNVYRNTNYKINQRPVGTLCNTFANNMLSSILIDDYTITTKFGWIL